MKKISFIQARFQTNILPLGAGISVIKSFMLYAKMSSGKLKEAKKFQFKSSLKAFLLLRIPYQQKSIFCAGFFSQCQT